MSRSPRPNLNLQRHLALVVVAAVGLYPLLVLAQEALQADADRSVSVLARVSMEGKFTDNLDLDGLNKRSALISEISPGIRLTVNAPRVKTYLDYERKQVTYARQLAPSQGQNALTAFGSVQAVDNWAQIDFDASIAQQAVSAFGIQSPDTAAVNPNRTEVSRYRISPRLSGPLGDLAQYEARLSRTVTDSGAQVASGNTVTDSLITLRSGKWANQLSWKVDLGRQSVSYPQGRDTEADSLTLGLSYKLSPQFQLLLTGGRERSNYSTADKQSYNTHGIGLNWLPSDLTSVLLTRNHRSFGNAYKLVLSHRSGRTVWKLTDTKEVSDAANADDASGIGSMYDLLFTQFASVEPNPVARATMVENFLQTNGIDPDASATSGFLTAAMSVQRRQELSFALLGLRDTITFIASRSETSRLDTLSASVDDLTNFGNVRQQGFSVQLAHRLTPDYSLGVLLSQQQTSAGSGIQDTRLRSLNVILGGRLGKRSTLSLGARHTVMDSEAAAYAEQAVTGHLKVQF